MFGNTIFSQSSNQGVILSIIPYPELRLERVNREIKRRTRVATLFPNTESCLRLVSAVLMEISEEWETGRAYINMNPDDNEDTG